MDTVAVRVYSIWRFYLKAKGRSMVPTFLLCVVHGDGMSYDSLRVNSCFWQVRLGLFETLSGKRTLIISFKYTCVTMVIRCRF